MEKKERQSSLELLRIIAMLMVLVMHYMYQTGALLVPDGELTPVSFTATLLESLSIVAVNVYVLISGFFLSASGFRPKRVRKLIGEVLFYTILIPVVLTAAGVIPAGEALNIYHIWNCIFPVQTEHYWFVTAYVVMCLFSPVLNAAIEHLTKKELAAAIGGLLLFFSVGKSVSIFRFASDRFGYDFGWFLCLYLIGGYMHKYGPSLCFRNEKENTENRKKDMGQQLFGTGLRSTIVYLASSAVIASVTIFCHVIYKKTGAMQYYFDVPFHYNYLMCLTGAIGLFYAFYYRNIPEGKFADVIRQISPYAFAVYLIHSHADVMNRWTGWVCSIGNNGVPQDMSYFLWMALHIIFVYICCTLADVVRVKVFALAGKLTRRKA